MRIPAYAIRIILVLAFFVAAGVRFSSTSGSLYPYYNGESAMNYRDALSVSGAGAGGRLDQPTLKSNWPEGYRPARARQVGVEYFAGAVIKTATWLSDDDPRTVARRLVVFFFSLCVFGIYGLTSTLWRSQTAGLLAAGLVAVLPPLIEATNGREINHTTFALFIVTLHLLSLQRLARGARITGSAGIAVTVFALVTSWELAPYYVVACVSITTLFYPLDRSQRRIVAVTHLIAFIVGVMVSPYAVASRMMFSWQAMFLAACCGQTFLTARFGGLGRGGAFILIVTAALTVALIPLRSGAEVYGLPAMKYVFYRARFLFARPESPSFLPTTIRHLWSAQHAHPSAHALLSFFLPVSLLAAAAIAEVRGFIVGGDNGSRRARVVLAAIAAALGLAAYAIDRSAIALAVLAAAPFVGLAGRALEGTSRARIGLAVTAIAIIVAQLLWPSGRANATLQLAKALGVAHRDRSQTLWISMANTDRELVRFVATRTSTRDPILGESDITALLLTFSGRTSVFLAGGRSSPYAYKRVDLTGYLYADEDAMFRRCKELGIRYVLYSIDYLLDTTRYSPLYLSGLTSVPETCVAVSMHFAPGNLSHFNLVYQNDRYRLYRVTERPEPVFLTDHPPVYQKDILELQGDSYESFRQRIGRIILTYTEAKDIAAAGDYEGAIVRLTWILQQAPRFTLARIALGATLLDKGQTSDARDVLMSVIQYAPDNADALYLAADALVQLREFDRATSLLEILPTVTNDEELLQRAALLEALIQQPDTTNSAP